VSAASHFELALQDALALMRQQRPRDAHALLRPALANATAMGAPLATRVDLHLLLADVCVALEQPKDARRELKAAQECLEPDKGARWLDVTLALAGQGGPEAKAAFEDARAWAKDPLRVAKLARAEARAAVASGKADEARGHYQRARATLGTPTTDDQWLLLSDVFADCGELAAAAGASESAVSLLASSVEALFRRSAADDLRAVEPARRLAAGFVALGQLSRAKELFGLVAKLIGDALGITHGAYGAALVDVGTTMLALGETDEAFELLRQTGELLERTPGFEVHHAHVLTVLASLLQADAERTGEARLLLHRALARLETSVGRDHVSTARVLRQLATSHWLEGEADQAEPLAAAALRIEEKADRASVGAALAAQLLGNIAAKRGDAQRARSLLQQALEGLKAAKVPHEQLTALVEQLATLTQ